MPIKILKYAGKYWLFILLTPLAVVLEVLLEIRIPFLMAQLVDVGVQNLDIPYVMRTGGMMILMALFSLIFGVLAVLLSARASVGFGSQLRKGLFDHVQGFSFGNLDRFSVPSLIVRLTADVNNIQNTFGMALRMLVRSPVMMISATFMAYSINSQLVRVFLFAVPFLAIALAIIAALAFPRFSAMLKKYDSMNASVQENLTGIRVVKSFVRSAYEKLKFKASNDDLLRAAIRAEKVLAFGMPLMLLTMYSCTVAILWFGGNMIIVGNMQAGELIGFISYVTQILISLMMLSAVFIMLILSRASAGRIMEVLAEKPSLKEDTAQEGLAVADGSIVFEDVSFKYQDEAEQFILQNLNLDIRAGQTVGILGGTGSAKTTLVQLIPRLYDASGGRVLVGGKDVRDYTLHALREGVAMVLQKNVLFSGTIAENLRWGNAGASDEELQQAAKAASAHDFIMSFPQGYETDLGQGGVNLSGGQKQRLAIARALLKKPRIIILDDSTSAVDTLTDAAIRRGLKKNLKGTTVIIIAQRIDSVAEADQIILMDKGRIAARGKHEELLAENEIYREIYHSQQKGVA